MRVKIPHAARVLVLDDNPERLEWFRESVQQASGHTPTCCMTVDGLIRELEDGEFDVVFLDHDLCWQDAAYSERKHGNGKKAARYLARMGFQGGVIIHSVNESGAEAMKSCLPQSRLAPFGTFELETAGSLSAARQPKQNKDLANPLTCAIYAASVPQPGRPNEDAFFVGRLAGAPLAAVFDGQGSAEGAAKKAARQLERLYTESRGRLDWTRTAQLLNSHLLGANKSTMVAASVAGDVMSLCAVGDSRAYLVRNCQANILTEGSSKQQLGSGAIQPLIKQFGAQDRDLILLMTDGAWTRFSLHLLAQTVMKNLMTLPELPNSILKQAAKGGVCDDMTVVAIVVRRR
jgi:serine/threonine protein phosphatase PrpC